MPIIVNQNDDDDDSSETWPSRTSRLMHTKELQSPLPHWYSFLISRGPISVGPQTSAGRAGRPARDAVGAADRFPSHRARHGPFFRPPLARGPRLGIGPRRVQGAVRPQN
ncbi:hypothetical protein NDU88_005495 [Pleurodeles waltl]|uniref:Uncharacterized protein n=1 Tax=Pleurodeles waltl TaxID=8319 RepID=A0AAV7TBI1_PLEWA|nr:hypothetical protein NDU88_005495 [Pleurodeles waltl]